MQASFVRNAVVLGLLTAIGPFAVDMYLPSLPSVAASFGSDADAALISMTAFFLTFALGQLIYGPSSDLLGRRRPLVAGIVIFIVASVGCATARSLPQLIGFRMLQGFGGASGMVIARAIVRDLHRGVDEARLLALLMLVFSVSPICAPLIGNGVIAVSSWRGVFWAVAGIAVIGLGLIALYIPETRPPAARGGARLSDVMRACGRLLVDRTFVGLTVVSSFAFSSFLVYLASSPFVLSHQYGQTSLEYSLAFSVNAIAFFAAMQLTARLAQRFGLARLIRPAVLGFAASLLITLGLAAAGIDQFAVVAVGLFVAYGFLGVIQPVASVLALDAHGEIAGTAASLMSALQLVTGSIMVAVSGQLGDGSIVRLLAAIAGCAVIAALGQLTLGRVRPGRAPVMPATFEIG